jgi:hypothetical protein
MPVADRTANLAREAIIMTLKKITDSISQHLFAEAEASVFAVLDGAAVPDLLPHLDTFEPDYVCLYRGDLESDMQEVAPYLVQVEPDSELVEWLFEQGWGKHWGIFAVAQSDLRTMRSHFRRFLTVYNSDGKPLLFRYYDPRVLRLYLPTCEAQELTTFFGPVMSYLLEVEDPNAALRFQVSSGSLQTENLQLSQD